IFSKDGYLFDKEAILTYIITKKKEFARKMKEYERQLKEDEEEQVEKANAETKKQVDRFISTEKNIVSSKTANPADEIPSTSGAISNVSLGKRKELPSFWVPSQTPSAKVARLEKPDSKIYCPISNKPLKMKELIDVKFTEVKDPSDKKSLIAKENRYMCAVTHDILNNSVPCAVLKTTGDVVTMECVEKIIKKDMIHPLTNEKLTESDIIPLQRGGTGFSTTNDNLQAKEERPALQC
ncbi:AAEL008402-PA, partial [Aedes aegypti]